MGKSEASTAIQSLKVVYYLFAVSCLMSVSLVLTLDSADKNLSTLLESPKNMAKARSTYFLKEGISIQAKQSVSSMYCGTLILTLSQAEAEISYKESRGPTSLGFTTGYRTYSRRHFEPVGAMASPAGSAHAITAGSCLRIGRRGGHSR